MSENDMNNKLIWDRVNEMGEQIKELQTYVKLDSEHKNSIDLKFIKLHEDFNDLKSELILSYADSSKQIMDHQYKLMQTRQDSMFKILGTALGSGGIVWLILDFLTKR